MDDLVARVMRELPDTDRNRYDIAYQRGRAQARSALLFGGLATGGILGAALMFLLDPERGRRRRAELRQQAIGRWNDLTRTAEGRSKDVRNRMTGFAIERGIKEPPLEHKLEEATKDHARDLERRELRPVGPGTTAQATADDALAGAGAGRSGGEVREWTASGTLGEPEQVERR